jgi:mannosyltransferase
VSGSAVSSSAASAVLRRVEASGPLIPVAVAVVLGLWRAGDKSIWLDEAVSVAIARLPTLDMLVYLWRNELHAAPYYMLLHPWLVLGQGEAAVRALSIIFGVMAVLATYAIGRRYGVGLPAALILAVHATFVQYEQEARGYTMLMAASAVSTLLLLRLLDQPTLRRALPYVALAVLSIYVHPLGALVIAAHGLAVLVFGPPGQRLRLLAVFVPVAVGWLPMLRFALLNRGRIDWIPPTTPELVAEHLLALGGGLLVSSILVVLLVLGARRDPLLLWLVLPIVGTLAISLLIQPTFQARYLVSVLPAAALIAARNRAVLVVLLVAASLWGTWDWYEHGEKEDWRSIAAHVSAEARPSDGIVFAPTYLRVPFGYYARVGQPLYPSASWQESDLAQAGFDEQRTADSTRVWLIEGHGVPLPEHVRQALADMVPASRRDYALHGLSVTLLIRTEAAGP